jgi:radical SAM protein with 4Fe4S-binding SPASM domain
MNTYCNLANTGLYVSIKGDISHCCIQKNRQKIDLGNYTDASEFYKENSHLSSIRQDLNHKNIKNSACQNCWKVEESGLASKRQRENELETTSETELRHLDLRLTNKCNLQCRMCSPTESSQIEKLAYELNDPILMQFSKNKLTDYVDLSTFLNSFLNVKTLKTIRFAGGEPFIMEEVNEFLSKLIENNMTDLEIEFITNCTSARTQVINKLEKFKRVVLGCSIDGVEDEFEYQRYPAKWSSVEKNFIKFYNSKLHVNITPCISFLTYQTLDKFFNWANQFPNARVFYNEVEQSFMDFRLIPIEHRQDFISKFKDIKFANAQNNWIQFQKKLMYEEKTLTDEDKKLLIHYIKIWDYKTNKKFLESYPWAEKLINE